MSRADQHDQDELRPEYTSADLVAGVRGKYAPRMQVQRLTLSLQSSEQEDGRWLARIDQFPDLHAYGDSCDEAIDRVEALAETAIAARVLRGELPPTGLNFAITTIPATPRHTPN